METPLNQPPKDADIAARPAGWLRREIEMSILEMSEKEAQKDEAAAKVLNGTIYGRKKPQQEEGGKRRDAWGVGAGLPTGDLE